MNQTAIQQAIVMARKRMESQNETLMGKHTAHYLQQLERELYGLLEEEKEQIKKAYLDSSRETCLSYGENPPHDDPKFAELYYKNTYEQS
tara:strand:+ start:261 stop:530 length:270 start_codon:yes stop_codon:yes gene_type:complete